MVRENRVKAYRFSSDDLVGDAISVYTAWPLNGLLQSVQIMANNYTATGSLLLVTSGTGEVIWSIASGTATGNISSSGTTYIRATTKGTDNSNQSGLSYAEIPLMDVYQLKGGVGVNKSGAGFNIYYI
jgi:hypothetical protein